MKRDAPRCAGCGCPCQTAYCDQCCPPVARLVPTIRETKAEQMASDRDPAHLQRGVRWVRRKDVGAR